jgi:hypothetical protein
MVRFAFSVKVLSAIHLPTVRGDAQVCPPSNDKVLLRTWGICMTFLVSGSSVSLAPVMLDPVRRAWTKFIADQIFTDFSIRWVLLGFCTLVVATWCFALQVSLDVGSVMRQLQFPGLLSVSAIAYIQIGNLVRKLHFSLAVVADWCLSVLQVLAVTMVLLPLGYLVATTGLPLLDGKPSMLDAMLGFDWETASRWVAERPSIHFVLAYAYSSMPFQAAWSS